MTDKEIRRKMHEFFYRWKRTYRADLAQSSGMSRSLVNYYFQGFSDNEKISKAVDALLVQVKRELEERAEAERLKNEERAKLLAD